MRRTQHRQIREDEARRLQSLRNRDWTRFKQIHSWPEEPSQWLTGRYPGTDNDILHVARLLKYLLHGTHTPHILVSILTLADYTIPRHAVHWRLGEPVVPLRLRTQPVFSSCVRIRLTTALHVRLLGHSQGGGSFDIDHVLWPAYPPHSGQTITKNAQGPLFRYKRAMEEGDLLDPRDEIVLPRVQALAFEGARGLGLRQALAKGHEYLFRIWPPLAAANLLESVEIEVFWESKVDLASLSIKPDVVEEKAVEQHHEIDWFPLDWY